MNLRTLGRTGLKVSVVGFGGIPIMKIGEEEAIRVVNRAIDLGINFFHTAPTYGDSASKIGKALKGRRNECILTVKCFGSTRKRTEAELNRSLRMLQTDRIEIVQFRITEQQFNQGMRENGGFQALKKAQKEGIIDHIGITDHDPKFLAKAVSTGHFSNIIVPFNYVFNGARDELLPLAKKMDVGVVAMKPLGRGVLLNVSEALNYIWDHGVSTAIVGMSSVEEVEMNASIGDNLQPLTQQQKEKLESLAVELGKRYKVENGALLPRE